MFVWNTVAFNIIIIIFLIHHHHVPEIIANL